MKKEIIEIYTKSGTFNNIAEIMRMIQTIRSKCTLTNFEEVARYARKAKNGKGILVELQVSTKACRDNDCDDFIDITAYEFDGELEEYYADRELDCVPFNGNWKTAIEQMKQLADDCEEA